MCWQIKLHNVKPILCTHFTKSLQHDWFFAKIVPYYSHWKRSRHRSRKSNRKRGPAIWRSRTLPASAAVLSWIPCRIRTSMLKLMKHIGHVITCTMQFFIFINYTSYSTQFKTSSIKYSWILVSSVNSGWNAIAILCPCWIAIISSSNFDKTLISSLVLS